MIDVVKGFAAKQKALVGLLAVVVVFAVLYAWDARQLAPMFSNVGTGSLIAAIALGVVLTYRGSGVVNFANGVVTIFIAFWYYGMRMEGKFYIPPLPNPFVLIEIPVNWFRDEGKYLDLPNWPTVIDLPGQRLTTFAAVAISLVIAVLLGLALHFLIFKPLRNAPVLAKVVTSVGLFVVLQEFVRLRFGELVKTGVQFPLPSGKVDLPGELGIIPNNQLLLVAVVVAISVVLWALFKYTRFGLATRAAAENEKGAIVLGFSPDFLAGANWVLSTLIAGLLGILASPITNLDTITLPLLIVPALGAALLANFTSFGLTVAAGIGIAMLQGWVQYQGAQTWFPKGILPTAGLVQALPFFVIVIAMFLRGKALPVRGAVTVGRMPFAATPKRVMPMTTVLVVATLVLLFGFSYDWRQSTINTLVAVAIALSFVVLVGFVGQISLAQMTIAGTAGFFLSKYFSDFPFPIGPIIGAFVAAIFGVIVSVPALRLRGVNLAVITLAAAVAIEQLVFNNKTFAGTTGALQVPPPTIGGKDFGPNNTALKVLGLKGQDDIPPNVWFGVVCLVFVVLLCLMVVNVRRSATGRQFLAVRSNERAAAAAGIDVARTKILAFGLAAFIAGLGGALSGYRFGSVTPLYFGAFASLSFLTFAYLGGIASVSGAVLAGVLAPNGLNFNFLENILHIDQRYAILIGGIGLIITAVQNPEGLAGAPRLIKQRQIDKAVRKRALAERAGVETGEGGQ
ncbi:MAG: ABC transporter permease subunit [Actinomycetota bacterium]